MRSLATLSMIGLPSGHPDPAGATLLSALCVKEERQISMGTVKLNLIK